MNFQEALINSLKKNSKNIAIINDDLSLTYAELLEKANKITAHFLNKGVKEGTYVGLIVENRMDFIASIIGVMNARCVFVPLDITLPESRLTNMIDQLALEYVISSVKSGNISSKIPMVFELQDILDTVPPVSLSYPDFDEEDSLYVYFTSGSTGVPKGVVGKNESLLQFVNWEINTFNIEESYRFSQFISPFFDAFLRDVFVPLLSGASICIPPAEDDFFSPEKMTKWIDENEISLIHCVPSVFKVFRNEKWLTSDLYDSLKYVLLSGEKIIPLELQKWYETFGERIQLVNLYGTTETTMIRSYYEISSKDTKKGRMPIGKPIDDTELLILDQSLKPNNILIPGDLYIASDFMTKGYLNNPELTNEKFVEIEGKKAFKTGDKARLLPSGSIELLGREDRQIKLRGVRVELDELEYVLMKSGFVETVVVMNQSDANSKEEFLVAFVKNKKEDSDDDSFIETLEAYAANELPKYMVPSRFIKVDSFPLLSSGKVDYKELLALADKDGEKVMIEAKDEVEERLLIIWKEILGDKPISTDDSFLRIGGNSLSLMRLIAKIYSEFKVRVPLGELFKNLSIYQQANFIKKSQEVVDHYKIEKAAAKPLYNLTTTQKRMYLNYDMDRENTNHNMLFVVKIKAEVNFEEIESIFLKVIERHESLRTHFIIEDEGIFQKIKDTTEFNLEEINVEEINDGIINFVRPFDLNKGPLFRAGIIYTGDGNSYLVTDMHHIIGDGISQRNLFTDFLLLYNEKPLESIPLQYKDYAEWEAKFVTTDAYISQREFWLKTFEDGVPKLKLPTMNMDISKISSDGGTVVFQIDKSIISPVIEELKKESNTEFSILYTCFALFLSQLTGQEDFVVGTASSGRSQEEIEKTIGVFVKTLPIRSKLDLHKSFRATVKDINSHLIEAMNNQLYDLSDIITELDKNKQQIRESLFNVMFTFQNYELGNINDLAKDFDVHYHKKSVAKYPISFNVNENEDSYEFVLEYLSAYFGENDVHALITVFKKLVTNISQNVDTKIYDIIADEEIEANPIENDITFNF